MPYCRPALTGEQRFFPRVVSSQRRNMEPHLSPTEHIMTAWITSNSGRRLRDSPEEAIGQDDTDDLPLTPEEDMPVIPDDERVIDVPS